MRRESKVTTSPARSSGANRSLKCGLVRFRTDLGLGDGDRQTVDDRREQMPPLPVESGRALQCLAVDGDDPTLPPRPGGAGSGLGTVAIGQIGADGHTERVAVEPGQDPVDRGARGHLPPPEQVPAYGPGSPASRPRRGPHSTASSMALVPETAAQAQTSKTETRQYQRPRRDRESGTASRYGRRSATRSGPSGPSFTSTPGIGKDARTGTGRLHGQTVGAP